MKPVLNLGDKYRYYGFGTNIYQITGVNIYGDRILYDTKVISSPRLNEVGRVYLKQIISSPLIKLSDQNHPLTDIFK